MGPHFSTYFEVLIWVPLFLHICVVFVKVLIWVPLFLHICVVFVKVLILGRPFLHIVVVHGDWAAGRPSERQGGQASLSIYKLPIDRL